MAAAAAVPGSPIGNIGPSPAPPTYGSGVGGRIAFSYMLSRSEVLGRQEWLCSGYFEGSQECLYSGCFKGGHGYMLIYSGYFGGGHDAYWGRQECLCSGYFKGGQECLYSSVACVVVSNSIRLVAGVIGNPALSAEQ